MDVRTNHDFSSQTLTVRVQVWEEEERQVRSALAARICPECGARLVAAGGCLECPACGWAACS